MRYVRLLPDLLTGSRLLFSIFLLAFKPFSLPFTALYLLCGLTDMADGVVARTWKLESDFGAKFDSLADFVFLSASAVKLVPRISEECPVRIWYGCAAIAVLRGINLVSAKIRCGRFFVLHTLANRLTGLLLFIFPLSLYFTEPAMPAMLIGAVAFFSALQEGYRIYTHDKKIKPAIASKDTTAGFPCYFPNATCA